jgi:dsDNA-specific endonuclease/ATPase MutS2
MNRSFKIGDQVAWIDEDLQGNVISIKKNTIVVETSDGFEIEAQVGELVLLPGKESFKVDWNELQRTKQNELKSKKPISPNRNDKKKKQPPLEVDLHIHELVTYTKNLSNFDMLNIQLDTAKRQIKFAKEKRIKRVVLIHGVGQGVLKAELETLLRRDEEVDFYDADYKVYGLGATEVYIYENLK